MKTDNETEKLWTNNTQETDSVPTLRQTERKKDKNSFMNDNKTKHYGASQFKTETCWAA